MKQHDVNSKTQEVGSGLSATIPNTQLVRRSRGRPMKEIPNGEVNTASIPTASTQVSPANADVVAASINHDTVCAYIASQSNGSQIKYEDINQINEDDIEEMDIKWNMALLTDDEAPKEFALMAKSSSSSENEVFDESFCSKSCRKNTDSLNTKISKLNEELSDSENTLYHYKLGLLQVKARLVEFKTQEIKFCEKIRGLEFDVESKNNKIEHLMNEPEKVKKEKDGLDSKLTGFEFASKDLDTLLGSQRSDKNKEGLPEFADDTITDYSRPSPSIESNTSDLQNSNASISEHGELSDSIMSKPMIKFVKAFDSPIVIKTNKTETARKPPVKYAEMYRNTSKSPKVRGHQRNWNNLNSQQLSKDFLMQNKACFKCGHFDNLAYDCGVWVEKGKNWPKNNIAHKNVTPRADLLKTGRTPIAVNRTNMNVAQTKSRTQFRVPRVSTVNT
nr:ubiquitin hydrolase [Tanacetum cinerariifolium]